MTETLVLRPLERRDLPALLALQHDFAGPTARWTAARLERELHDPARDGGRKVVVAERGGRIVGAAGWVEAGAQLFGAPVLAADAAAAGALLDHLVARGRAGGAATLRVSATPADRPKIEALSARGFDRLFDFITVARTAAPVDPPPSPLRRVELASVPVAPLRELYNETFAGVPNAPPLDDDAAAHALASLWADGSGVWLDGDGAPVGFVWGTRERDDGGEHAMVDSVGVRAAWRGRGVGVLLVSHLLNAAARAGVPEVRALIASINEPSLALHRALGFAEAWRIGMWELRLPAGPQRW